MLWIKLLKVKLMKKNNLKAGMILITRGGESFLVLPYSGTSSNLYAFNTKNSNQVNLDIWDDNLLNKFENTAMDVIEIQAIKSFTTVLPIWCVPGIW